MTQDSYGSKDTIASCVKCSRFMPWSRSVLVEQSDGMPYPSPVLVEVGLCKKCMEVVLKGQTDV